MTEPQLLRLFLCLTEVGFSICLAISGAPGFAMGFMGVNVICLMWKIR